MIDMTEIKNFRITFFLILFCTRLFFLQAQTVSDVDDNIYSTITVGKQIWMSENLKTTRYNDGNSIPLIIGDNSWSMLETPAYCWLNNDNQNKEVYGALYNWYAVDTKKLCPKGWHVPANTEWITFAIALGDENTAGARIKESGTTHWKNTIRISTDEFGFTALPAGMRLFYGSFPEFPNDYTVWWTSTGVSEVEAWNRGLFFSSTKLLKAKENKKSGFSVRCIRD